jgi:DNA-binding GntR family transcriptional regulator
MPSSTVRQTSAPRPRKIKRSRGFVDEIVEMIRADIISLRIPPDTRISIDNLARQLGVSQTPIREALSRLEATGLVSKQRFVGYCSAPQVTREQLDELFELRLQLEPFAARCATERMTDAELEVIAAISKKLGQGNGTGPNGRFSLQDYSELHNLIASGTHNSLIADALANLHAHVQILRLQLNAEMPREAHAELKAVIRAVTSCQPAEAEAAMRTHIERSYERLQAAREATQP